jgi:enolase
MRCRECRSSHDLFVTNKASFGTVTGRRFCPTLFFGRCNQIGTLTEAMETATIGVPKWYGVSVSERSGETETR